MSTDKSVISNDAKQNMQIAGSVVFLLFLGTCWCLGPGKDSKSAVVNPPPVVFTAPINTPAPRDQRRFTYRDYQQSLTGAFKDEIDLLTGCAVMGKEISSGGGGGHCVHMYQWQNPDGSNMVATFVDRRLTSKAQSGLSD